MIQTDHQSACPKVHNLRHRMPRLYALILLLGTLSPMTALDTRKSLTQYSTSVWTQQQGLPQDAIHPIRSDGGRLTLARHRRRPRGLISRERGAGKDGSLWIASRNPASPAAEPAVVSTQRGEVEVLELIVEAFPTSRSRCACA
jgi:hypothetical protein